jgi:Mg2+ and Co2+ transporter CorA
MHELVPSPDDVILTGYTLDGPGHGHRLSPSEAPDVLRSDTLGWVHLRAQHPDTPGWIVENLSYLDPTIIDALVAEETRPRVTMVGKGLIVILRGINTIEGEDPEDMISKWHFEEKAEGGVDVHFFVDFEFKNRILQGAAGMFFYEAMQRIVRAFERRAAELYG